MTLWARVKAVMILASGEPAAAAEEEPEQEQQVVPAAQDVLDAEQRRSCASPRRRDAASRVTRVSRVSGANANCVRAAGAVDPGQRVVVGAEDVEEVVADQQLADGAAAGEVHDERHALRARRGRQRAIQRPAAQRRALGGERHLVADDAEQPVAAGRVTVAGAPQLLGHRRRQRRRPEREAVPDARRRRRRCTA